MNSSWTFRMVVQLTILVLGAGLLQAQSAHGKQNQVEPSVNGNSSVKGSGTPDRIAKWVGDREIGDSEIIETGGNVAIGTTPSSSSRLLVSALLDTGATVRASNVGDGRAVEGTSANGIGVVGRGGFIGVSALSTGGFGLFAQTQTGTGIRGGSTSGDGMFAFTASSDPAFAAIRAVASPGGALAGRFTGDVAVSGMLSKGGGSFKIDHPLDPENKYLYHSFVESPDMMNIYNGNITTDENGDAVVMMPEYFEALNADFRYQLTVIGTFAQAIVAEKVNANRFVIKTSAPNVEVSWQVTGVRQDAFAKKNRIQVEEQKNERERGFYLHPEAFNQSEERGVEWEHTQGMRNERKAARGQSTQQQR